MVAESVIAIVLLVFCAGWIVGYEGGKRQERHAAKLRLERARRIYIGGMRDW